MNERTKELLEYLDLLINATNAGHRLNREVLEVIQAIRENLNLKSNGNYKKERPDGALLSENGLYIKSGNVKFDFPNKAKTLGKYFLIDSLEQVNLTVHSIKHECKFLKLNINFKPDGEYGHFELIVTDGTDIYGSITTKVFNDTRLSLLAELGEPTGQTKTLYVKAKSLEEDSATLIQIGGISQEG
ncbi:hypothetical protein CHH83_02580 [Bacillus sp. 7586-K]|nr:hypothetical protein CHH83_02580 [Bacillus sp. 7586-K]